MIKSLLTLASAAALGLALPVQAAPDAAAAQALAKENGCTKCHATDKDKKGPSYSKVAAKYKGKADGEAKITEFLGKSPKVKLDDGSEEEHKAIKAKDAAQTKNLVQWVLAQ